MQAQHRWKEKQNFHFNHLLFLCCMSVSKGLNPQIEGIMLQFVYLFRLCSFVYSNLSPDIANVTQNSLKGNLFFILHVGLLSTFMLIISVNLCFKTLSNPF